MAILTDSDLGPKGAFPVAHSKDVKGAPQNKATLADLNAVPAYLREEGQIGKVTADPTAANNGEYVAGAGPTFTWGKKPSENSFVAASNAEVLAGTENSKGVTPKSLAEGVLGFLANLSTTAKDSIVAAINEVKTGISNAAQRSGGNTFDGAQTFVDGLDSLSGIFKNGKELDQLYASKNSTSTTAPYFSTPPTTNPVVSDIAGGKRYAETAAVINNAGTSVNIPAANIDVLNATTGNNRIDLIVARYIAETGKPVGYERVPGTESTTTAAAPGVPAGTLFVRSVNVTDAGSTGGSTDLETRVTNLEINKLEGEAASRTGMVLSFDKASYYGITAAETGAAFSLAASGHRRGVILTVYHQAAAIPALPANTTIRNGTYAANSRNKMVFEFISANEIDLYIN